MGHVARIETAGLSRLGLKHTSATGMLTACRVLVLEDEYFLADDLERALKAQGATVLGPFAELSDAKAQVADGGFDVAIVDIDLRGQSAFPIADELMRHHIPFVFATGYDPEILPVRFRGIRQWGKPLQLRELIEEIGRLCGRKRDQLGVALLADR